MKKILTKLSIVFLLFLSYEAIGQNLAPADMLKVNGHYIHSTINKKTYQLFVSLPRNYSPKDTTHYPVLYFLDGLYTFPLIYSTKMLLDFSGEIENVIIVSIADSMLNKQTWFASRWTDYTPSHSAADDSSYTSQMRMPKGFLKSGGATAFLNTIRNHIIPFIDNQYKTTNDRGIAGHSLGGLFAGYCLLSAPDLFKRYGINSPSFWWDKKRIFEMEKLFSKNNKVLDAQIFMSVGSLESEIIGEMMVTSMTGFADSLQSHKYKGLTLTSNIFDNETHLSVVPAMISRTLRVLYGAKRN